MKYHFQKEDHNRQDKAKKGDYLEDLRERVPTTGSWSGVNVTDIQRRAEVRQLELPRATAFYFVYGKWLYQNTKKLSHFAQLNSVHTISTDADLEPAFQKCRRSWASDSACILNAIKNAPVMRPKGLPRWFPGGEVVAWELPPDMIADEVWRQIPPAFKALKKAPSVSTSESPPPPTSTTEQT
jgi:hypothetical protein